MMSIIIKGAEDTNIESQLAAIEQRTDEFRRLSAELATIRAVKRHRLLAEQSTDHKLAA